MKRQKFENIQVFIATMINNTESAPAGATTHYLVKF